MIYLLGGWIGLVAIYWSLASYYLSPTRRVPEKAGNLQDVWVPTRDQWTPAWVNPAFRTSSTIFVLVHGYGGTRGRWGPIMADLEARGIGAIAPAMPGQDASPFRQVGFGVAEAQVVCETVTWVRQTRGTNIKIILCGASLGGAACWLASERIPDVSGVVTEGAFARFDESMNAWFDRALPLGRFFLRPVVWIARARTGINPSTIVPMDAARHWRGRPALVIQGADDTLITGDHARRLSDAAQCELWTVSGARHVDCYEINPPAYIDKICRFAAALK